MANAKMEHNAQKQMDNAAPWKVGCLILSVLLVISVLTQGFGFASGNANAPTNNAQPTDNGQQGAQPVVKADLKEGDDPVNGDKSAPIKIFEFTDYQCPFCSRAFQQTYPQIKKLVQEGKVRYVIKDYPLPFHPNAAPAATAANCANAQGKYWDMHEKLFSTQDTWSSLPDATDTFKTYAKELGLDEKKFASCLTDPKVAKEIQDDVAEGSAAGVSGTPTFYINGVQLVGAQPWAAFEQIINQELSK